VLGERHALLEPLELVLCPVVSPISFLTYTSATTLRLEVAPYTLNPPRYPATV
jgi:hypothetical protein